MKNIPMMGNIRDGTDATVQVKEYPERLSSSTSKYITASPKSMNGSEVIDMISVGESDLDPTSSEIDTASRLLFIQDAQNRLRRIFSKPPKVFGYSFVTLLLLSYVCYFVFALRHSVQGAMALIVLTPLVILGTIYSWIRNRYGIPIYSAFLRPIFDLLQRHRDIIAWVLCPLLAVLAVFYLVMDVYQSTEQLIPLSGLAVLLFITLVTSKHVTRIQLRPVVFGIVLQFVVGVLVLRWRPGYLAVKFLSDQMSTFLSYSLAGSAMAFGDPFFLLHPFVFMVTSMIIFVGGVTGLLFHLGVIQTVVSKMAWLMRHTFGVTGIESISIVSNIFFQTLDLMQMFRSYIPKLTQSEFHTFSVGCHASIAGFAFGLFVVFGANPQHLMTASVMSAPAAIAISKLNYPETEESQFKDEDDCEIEKIPGDNPLEAISTGSWQAAKMVMVLLVQVLVFMSGFEWLDATVTWIGARVGFEISLRIIFSYLFMPVGYIIGIPQEEIKKVSSIVGLKLAANEMLAFMELGNLRSAGEISERSAALTTYAICGFSSIGTLVLTANVWATISKQRAQDAIRHLPRVFMNCNIACFFTACIAGILYNSEILEEPSVSPGSAAFLDISKNFPSYKDIMNQL